MIKMANIELIRKLHFVENRSIRQISKDLGYSRQTIRKALEHILKFQSILAPSPQKCHLDSVKPLIVQWLKDDETAPQKQRHSAAQIYRRLVITAKDFYHFCHLIYHQLPLSYQDKMKALQTRNYKSAGLSFCLS